MRYTDVDYAKSLTDIEQWGHQESDFKRLVEMDPQGCFVAWDGDERVGIATTISYGEYAFLGNIIVEKQRRGGSIGPRLMKHAVDYLDRKGMKTIELDGVLSAVAMYRRMGFRDKYYSLRLARKPQSQYHALAALSRCPEPLPTLADFDYQETGIRRQALISSIAGQFPETTFCFSAPRLEAYGVVRERSHGAFAVGPLVAHDPGACSKIVREIVAVFGDKQLTIGVPEVNKAAVRIMLHHDFHYGAPSMRMYRGQSIAYEEHIYGIVSADVG